MGRLYLIRHGETNFNRQRIYSGRSNVGLNMKGKAQAKTLSKLLKNEPVDFFFCSPLARARQTAQFFSSCDKITFVPELREINFGKWEGLSFAQIEKYFGDELSEWLNDPIKNRIPGGESYADVRKRVLKFLNKIIREHPRKNIIMVTHHTPFKVILAERLNLGNEFFWDIAIDNTGACFFKL